MTSLRSSLFRGDVKNISKGIGESLKKGPEAITDAAKTLTANSASTQICNVPITANRTITLPTNVAAGTTFRVVRTSAATGAFALNVGSGPVKALSTAGTFADVEYNGTAWVLTGGGTL